MVKIKVISGGQTGADLAGLWAARSFGVETGGFAPSGWQTQHGPRACLADMFGLRESHAKYHEESLMNCESSTITAIFASDIKSTGTKLTIHRCASIGVRYRVYSFRDACDPDSCSDSHADRLASVLSKIAGAGPVFLNVAGNSTATSASSFTITFYTMCKVFSMLGHSSDMVARRGIGGVEPVLRDCYDASVFSCL